MRRIYKHNTIQKEQNRWVSCVRVGTELSLVYHDTYEAAKAYLDACILKLKDRERVVPE